MFNKLFKKINYITIFFIFILMISCSQYQSSNTYYCDPNPCTLEHQSICVPEGDSYTCKCDPGYQLDSDEAFCIISIGSCAQKDCSGKPHTHCEVYGVDAICACNNGYSIIDGECSLPKDPCKNNPCASNSDNKTLCNVIDKDNHVCLCEAGYRLKNGNCVVAEDNGNRYNNLGNSKNLELINKLHTISGKGFHSLSYNQAKRKLTDIDGKTGAYTGLHINGTPSCEHVWPQSYFNEQLPMKSDLHHLKNTLNYVNSKRGNIHFGNVERTDCDPDCGSTCSNRDDCFKDGNCCWYCDWSGKLSNGTQTVAKKGKPNSSCGSHSVFEPQDSIKGDIARALFYFAVRYKNQKINESQNYGTGKDNYISYKEEQILRLWHYQDPVDDTEYKRNTKVENAQGNRNPFIDRPDLVGRISDF